MTLTTAYRFRSLVGSWKAQLSSDDAYLLAQLPTLQTAPLDQLAGAWLDLTAQHPLFKNVERLCFVTRVGNGNQLSIVSSRNRTLPNEAMQPGYHCFVSPRSSLFSMIPGAMRSYPDTQVIVESFKAHQKPVQRSIGLLHQAGLKSGLCLPLMSEERVIGYLFLNSLSAVLDQPIANADCILINIFAEMFRSRLLESYPIPSSYQLLPSFAQEACQGQLFNLVQLQGLLGTLSGSEHTQGPVRHAQLDVAPGMDQSIVSHTHVAFALAQLINCLGKPSSRIRLRALPKRNLLEAIVIDMQPRDEQSRQKILDICQKELAFLGVSIGLNADQFNVTWPCDFCSAANEGQLYSVEPLGQEFTATSLGSTALDPAAYRYLKHPSYPRIDRLGSSQLISVMLVSLSDQHADSSKINEAIDAAHLSNEKHQLTGFLTCYAGLYLQVLEGEKQQVLEVLPSIESNPRHTSVYYLGMESIEKRYFPHLTLAFRASQSLDFELLQTFFTMRPQGSTEVLTKKQIHQTLLRIQSLVNA